MVPTCAVLPFCLQLDLRLVNNGEGQLPWHGTGESRSVMNKEERKSWGGKLNKGGCSNNTTVPQTFLWTARYSKPWEAVGKLSPLHMRQQPQHLQKRLVPRVLIELPFHLCENSVPLKDLSSPESLDSSVPCGIVCQFTPYKTSDKCKRYSDRSL